MVSRKRSARAGISPHSRTSFLYCPSREAISRSLPDNSLSRSGVVFVRRRSFLMSVRSDNKAVMSFCRRALCASRLETVSSLYLFKNFA